MDHGIINFGHVTSKLYRPFVAWWAPIEGASPIPYTMVPNFLGHLNLTPQYPTLPSDIARNWRWTFGPYLSER